MTTKPPPCEPPVRRLRRPVEVVDVVLERRVHDGDEDLAADADGDADEVDRAGSAGRGRGRSGACPGSGWPATGAPMKPIHRPSRVETTYHSGGTEAEAMACICGAGLAGDGARRHSRRSSGADLAGQEPDHGVEEPDPALALGLRRDPGRVEEGDVAAGAAAGGRGGRHTPGHRCGGAQAAVGLGGRAGGGGAAVPAGPTHGARTRPERARRACGRARGPGRPPGSVSVIGKTLPGPHGPPPAGSPLRRRR